VASTVPSLFEEKTVSPAWGVPAASTTVIVSSVGPLPPVPELLEVVLVPDPVDPEALELVAPPAPELEEPDPSPSKGVQAEAAMTKAQAIESEVRRTGRW
jgi:hypothetical protein